MDEYLNKGIKEIIEEFPEVESVLNDQRRNMPA
jgi:hypothetical protein